MEQKERVQSHQVRENVLRSKLKKQEKMDRQEEQSQARMAARLLRSPKQQLEALDRRLGKGKGAKKERARLKEKPLS